MDIDKLNFYLKNLDSTYEAIKETAEYCKANPTSVE